MFNYHRAQFVRRGYERSAMTPTELAEGWECDRTTINSILHGRTHTQPRASVYREDICLNCHLAQCVYNDTEWPSKELKATCPLEGSPAQAG